MSTDGNGTGGKDAMAALARDATAEVSAAAEAEHLEQMDLLEPLSSEETAAAQEELGPQAGPLAVLKLARENRSGRRKGTPNRRTADTMKYLSQFGPDPARAMMTIIAESEEAMVARSRQVDPYKRQLTLKEARDQRIRCMETMMPYFHGKKPVQIDTTVRGVMLNTTIGEVRGGAEATIDGIVGFAARQVDEDEGGDD